METYKMQTRSRINNVNWKRSANVYYSLQKNYLVDGQVNYNPLNTKEDYSTNVEISENISVKHYFSEGSVTWMLTATTNPVYRLMAHTILDTLIRIWKKMPNIDPYSRRLKSSGTIKKKRFNKKTAQLFAWTMSATDSNTIGLATLLTVARTKVLARLK